MLVTQSYLTLCDPVDYSLPSSSVHGVIHPGILEWLPFPPLGDLPNPGFKPESPAFQKDYLLSELQDVARVSVGMLKKVISRTQSTSRVRIPNSGQLHTKKNVSWHKYL